MVREPTGFFGGHPPPLRPRFWALGALLGLYPRPRKRRARAFSNQNWLVTFERQDGEIRTDTVLINGGNLVADIEVLAQIALHHTPDTQPVTILCIRKDNRITPAQAKLLQSITNSINTRRNFEAECG